MTNGTPCQYIYNDVSNGLCNYIPCVLNVILILDIDECSTGDYNCTQFQQCVNWPGDYQCVCVNGKNGTCKGN